VLANNEISNKVRTHAQSTQNKSASENGHSVAKKYSRVTEILLLLLSYCYSLDHRIIN